MKLLNWFQIMSSLRTLARLNPLQQATRTFSSSPAAKKWTGRKPEDHVVRETDSHNVHFDAAKEGKEDRAKGQEGKGSRGAGEGSGGSNKKAKGESLTSSSCFRGIG